MYVNICACEVRGEKKQGEEMEEVWITMEDSYSALYRDLKGHGNGEEG